MESYAGMVSETLEDLAPEERHRIYKLLRLGVRYRPDWPLEITGIFAQVAEEAEMGSSDANFPHLAYKGSVRSRSADREHRTMYGENAPPSWARLPGARCRAVEHLTKLDGLKEFELFEGLEEGFFQDLAIAAEVLELGRRHRTYREGEPSGAVYFVGEGRVKLYRTSGGPKVRDQIFGVVGDGSVLGLGAAIEGRTQGQGATALTDCVLYAVFRDDLFEIMGASPTAPSGSPGRWQRGPANWKTWSATWSSAAPHRGWQGCY